MKEMILVTTGFPFGIHEQSFIYPEMQELIKEFNLTIVTNLTPDDEILIPMPDNINVFRYNTSLGYKMPILFIKSIFCKEVYKEILYCSSKGELNFKSLSLIIKRMMRVLDYENYLKSVRETIKADNVIYYTYWNNYMTLAATRLKKEGDKVITRLHRKDLYQNESKTWLPYKNITNDNVDAMFFISEHGRQYYKESFKDYGDKMKLCYLGVKKQNKLSPFTERDTINILSFSYISEVKRIELIIDTISKIDECKINWTHIGGGQLEQEIKSYADNLLSNKKNVQFNFTGYMSNEDALSYVRENEFDFLLNTSFSEGLPVTMMESMSLGIPVIGTDVGGVGEIIKNKYNGFLIDRDFQTSELVNVILDYYKLTFEQKQTMRKNAYKTWEEKFCDMKNHKEFVEIINQL